MSPGEALLAPIPDAVLGRAPAAEPGPVATPVAAGGAEETTKLTGDSLVMERPLTAAQSADVTAAPVDPMTAVMADIASRDVPGGEPGATTGAPARPMEADGPSAVQLVLASIAGNLIAAAGWAFSLGIVLALGWMAVYHRTGIMHAWPPSQRLFTWLGLA